MNQGKKTDKALIKDQASPIPDNSICNNATSHIVIEYISITPENLGNQANENNESNTNEENITKGSKFTNSDDQTNNIIKINSSRQLFPKIDREHDKLQDLLQELFTLIKGETDKDNVNEGSNDSMSQSLV
ncbi:14240_t:CDS:2 [Acaulospora morrowiae]|uniref:14240_t:CDS:1 n=1 Tax=Acaulospora morrowiae TaxID=94023 RepID=A0A9N9FV83_9GLOM|nr:14240_t:CDS:2 [Acaulospora morrowiae]